jgi:hypothetical protein
MTDPISTIPNTPKIVGYIVAPDSEYLRECLLFGDYSPAEFDSLRNQGIPLQPVYTIDYNLAEPAAEVQVPEVQESASEPTSPPTDSEILDWLLPVISGIDSVQANKRTVELGFAVMTGLSGRDAVIAAMKPKR